MDCHRCEYIRYAGCRYGRCSHKGHVDVVLVAGRDGKRPYNRQICPDFKLRKKCSNCIHWIRGEYFADGKTPARRGACELGKFASSGFCTDWKLSTRTSWRKDRIRKTKKENER